MRHRLLPLLLLLASLQLSHCQLTVDVTTAKVELQESGQSFGRKLVLPPGTSVAISCIVKSSSALSSPKVEWRKVAAEPELDNRFETSEKLSDDKRTFTSTLAANRLVETDIVNYSCNASAGSQRALGYGGLQSLPLPSLKVETSELNFVEKSEVSVWAGGNVRIICDVGGNPKGDVEWSRESGKPVVAVNNSFSISGVSYEKDRGFILCKSSNSLGKNSVKLFLRVKNPTAFVLPLIILIVEIVIIVVIVVAYELYMRHKRQQDAEPKSD